MNYFELNSGSFFVLVNFSGLDVFSERAVSPLFFVYQSISIAIIV